MRLVSRPRPSVVLAALSLLALSANPSLLHAQAAAKPPATTTNTASGFSIETEMLTYRALESNSDAIACDVASYLSGTATAFKKSASGGGNVCALTNAPANIGIVVLPFDRSAFADFQIWRSDMETMAEFEQRGAAACAARHAAESTTPPPTPPPTPGAPEPPHGRGLTSATVPAAATNALGMFTPGGAAVGAASGVLGLFANNQESSPVGGTIEDQAFMDDVSRDLRQVNFSVIMPAAYPPFSLTSIDATRSPFVTALYKLHVLYSCLPSSDPEVKDIDTFLNSLTGATTPAKSTAPGSGSSSASTSTTPAPATTTPPAAPSSSHLQAVLSADGLAQRLGANVDTGLIPATAAQHLLLVKALEIPGGSVSHSSNLFGSKLSFSGGSVGTYSLFNLAGDLECSGNVYEYAGPVPAKKFERRLRAFAPDPSSQVIIQRGACKAK